MIDETFQGYDVDNPNIDLLKLRNYTIGKKLKDDEVLGAGGLDRITNLLGTLTPFVSYLNSVVMPDEDPSDDDDDEDEDEGQNGDDWGYWLVLVARYSVWVYTITLYDCLSMRASETFTKS